jgi:hypothetical protein
VHSRSLISLLGAVALLGAMPSGRVPPAAVPVVETMKGAEVASFSTPTLARPGPTVTVVAMHGPTQMLYQVRDAQRVEAVKGLDLFTADVPQRRQAVKLDRSLSLNLSDLTVTANDLRWRVTTGHQRSSPLRI